MKKTLLFALALFFVLSASAEYVVFPTPHEITPLTEEPAVTPCREAVVVCSRDIDDETRARVEEVLTQQGFTCRFVDKARKAARSPFVVRLDVDERLHEEGVFDSHRITLTNGAKGVVLKVVGEHTNAVFFGLATVEQMLAQTDGRDMPCVIINDHADQQYRGIVEGYYGFPYTTETRIDLMEWGKHYKLNTYIYGPKSDPYHLGYWREDYPDTVSDEEAHNGLVTAAQMQQLADASHHTKVDLIWAAHPAMSNPVDLSTREGTLAGARDLLRKFDHLYSLGVRQFGIFLDDISVANGVRDCDNHALLLQSVQDSLIARYNGRGAKGHHRQHVNPADTVRPLHFVPTPYALNFASDKDLTHYFSAISGIDPSIVVYFTGSGVWSNIAEKDYDKMAAYVGRRVAMWWNFPCNDNNDRNIYLMDVDSYYRTDPSLTSSLGIVCNPMAQGEASKVTLFGVADYCWNVKAFDSRSNWEHAFAAVVPSSLADDFKAFAPYAMKNEPTSLGDLIEAYETKGLVNNRTELLERLVEIRSHCTALHALSSSPSDCDRRLYEEISFWIDKLEEMCSIAIDFIGLSHTSDEVDRWNAYLPLLERCQRLTSDERFTVVQRENAGFNYRTSEGIVTPSNRYLMPFVERLCRYFMTVDTPREGLVRVEEVSLPPRGIYSGDATAVVDGNPTTFLWTAGNQHSDDCVTVKLKNPTSIYDVRVVLMKNDRPHEGVVELSDDGQEWVPAGIVKADELIQLDDLDAWYKDIAIDGVKASFVRFRLSGADTSKWFKIAGLDINRHNDRVHVAASDAQGPQLTLCDNDLSTSCIPSGTLMYTLESEGSPSELVVYLDEKALEGCPSSSLPTVALSADGRTWTDAGVLRYGIEHIDLTSFRHPRYARFTFNSNYLPSVYEIAEQ